MLGVDIDTHVWVGGHIVSALDELRHLLSNHRVTPGVGVSTHASLERTEKPSGTCDRITGENCLHLGMVQQEGSCTERQYLCSVRGNAK